MTPKKRRPLRSLFALLVTTIIACGALVFGHHQQGASYTPLLALDLEGGTQLILTPVSTSETDRAITEQDISEAINVIRQRVDASGVAEAEITSLGSSNIVVALPGNPSEETLNLIRTSSQMVFRSVLQVAPAQTMPDHQGVVQPQSGDLAQSADQPQSVQTVSTAIPVEEAKKVADLDQDGKLADTPTNTPADNSSPEWITEQTLFDFATLDCSSAQSSHIAAQADPSKATVACDKDGDFKYILGPVDVSGAELSSASAAQGRNSNGQPNGQWTVALQFDSTGTEKFAQASTRLFTLHQDPQASSQRRDAFAVVLDGRVITAPSMNAVISNGQAEISGNFTVESASILAKQLNFGSLPLNFEVQSEQQISATLGADHLSKGIWAGLVGLVLVVLYLLWQYRGLGLLAASSLFVAGGLTYLVITLLSWLVGYRLSLAGVAGLIVSVGVTADSFIVYFERIRDEVRDGHPIRSAVTEGWQRAKQTILVSDAVNLVAALVLYILAVGGVQGFAFTLGVTTIVDLIVIFWFTHPMMELLVKIPFFGNGHKLSGLDPENLGAKSAVRYAGRGRVANIAPQDGLSLAERRYKERQKAQDVAGVENGGEN